MNKIEYNIENCIEIPSSGKIKKTVIDLNMAVTQKFFSDALKYGVRHGDYVEIPDEEFNQEAFEIAKSIKSILLTYELGGRKTVVRYLHKLFRFQSKHGFKVGSINGVMEFLAELKGSVFSKEIKDRTASGHLSAINKFLTREGEISIPIKYNFSNATKSHEANATYSTDEFQLVMHLLFKLQKAYEVTLSEQLDKVNSGNSFTATITTDKYHFPYDMSLVIQGAEYKYEAQLVNLIRNYVISSFLIFIFYTDANKSVAEDLTADDMTAFESGAVSSGLKFKGRGFKFVRIGIGASETDDTIDMQASGIKFFQRYMTLRERIVDYYQELGGHIESNNLWLSPSNKEDLKLDKANLSSFTSLNNNNHWWKISQNGVEYPNFSSRAIRKAVEQLIDSEGQDPLLTLNKAQHNWETYQKNYAKGNETEMLKSMSNALNLMVVGGKASLTEEQRLSKANEKDITIVASDDDSYAPTASGLGCKQSGEQTLQEKTFFREQNRSGYEPKVCANILECLECDKCGVVDDSDLLYEVLSYRQAILMNKTLYVGSNKAKSDYEKIVTKLNERLLLVNPKNLNTAQRKINNEGVSDTWKILI